jgi:hypothetical protein
MREDAVQGSRSPNGAALAAVVSAGVGALAMGLFVLVHEAGVYSAPSLYAPAGGLSGRSTFAVIVWLAAWGILHARWRTRQLDSLRLFLVTLVLVALGVIATYPPVWQLL